MLLNPREITKKYADTETEKIMLSTIDFFESMGLDKIKADYESRRWYRVFRLYKKRADIC